MSRYLVQATWDDCAHLTQEAKDDLWQSIPRYQRDARSKGIPVLGAGAIYGVPEADIVIDDIPIPEHWPRCFGMDVAWSKTAVAWLALNRETDCLYLYAEHYRGEAEPVIHAEAIKARGAWIKGAIDPSARGRSQVDGRQLLQMYQDLGLNVIEADNTVESGIYEILTRMTTGRFKAFRSCQNFLGEFRLYRRDEKGKVVKERDHLCDSLRYAHSRLHEILSTQPVKREKRESAFMTASALSTGWMG